MNNDEKPALVPKSLTGIEKVQSGEKRIIFAMVTDALALARNDMENARQKQALINGLLSDLRNPQKMKALREQSRKHLQNPQYLEELRQAMKDLGIEDSDQQQPHMNVTTSSKHEIETKNRLHGKNPFFHTFSLYTMTGERVPHEVSREDLFAVITGMERYIVDSHSDWRNASRQPRNANKAFIVGRTVADETENLNSVFHSDKVDVSNKNIFNFSLNNMLYGQTLVWIERVDKTFLTVLDHQKMQEEKKPFAERTDENFVQRRKDRMSGIEPVKKKILAILKVNNIDELAPRAELSELEAHLTDYIQSNSRRCFGHWTQSAKVADYCYALLLLINRNMHKEFADPNYPNVLGDTMLVHNALFFRAKIFSKDSAPKKMASYVGDSEITAVSNIA